MRKGSISTGKIKNRIKCQSGGLFLTAKRTAKISDDDNIQSEGSLAKKHPVSAIKLAPKK